MRALVVMGAGLGALALWVWLTGPGTNLALALGGGICAVVASRLAYRLLTPRDAAEPDTAPPAFPARPPTPFTPPPRPGDRGEP